MPMSNHLQELPQCKQVGVFRGSISIISCLSGGTSHALDWGEGARMCHNQRLLSLPECVSREAENQVLWGCLLGLLWSVFTDRFWLTGREYFSHAIFSACLHVIRSWCRKNIYPMKVHTILKMTNTYFINNIWESVLPLATCQNMGAVIRTPPVPLIESRDVSAI